MPSFARKCIVDPEVVGTYHCTSRCVRRAHLCGYDELNEVNYDHRKLWVEDRIEFLSQCFFVDIGNYAVMCNHFHINIRIRPDLAEQVPDEEIVERWWRLFPKISCVSTSRPIEIPSIIRHEWLNDKKWLMERRKRLSSLSWFMRCLCEYIARKANKEDGVKGRFWEGRFKSQALLDDAAVLAAGTYIDLNPVRAGLSDSPEDSDFCSIQDRIHSLIDTSLRVKPRRNFLSPIERASDGLSPDPFIDMNVEEYIALVDWYGRCIVEGKRGYIPADAPDIFDRIGFKIKCGATWLSELFKKNRRALGSENSLRKYAESIGQHWIHGVSFSREVFV